MPDEQSVFQNVRQSFTPHTKEAIA
jgi:hypothetical protein